MDKSLNKQKIVKKIADSHQSNLLLLLVLYVVKI